MTSPPLNSFTQSQFSPISTISTIVFKIMRNMMKFVKRGPVFS